MADWSKHVLKGLLALVLTVSSAGLITGCEAEQEGPDEGTTPEQRQQEQQQQQPQQQQPQNGDGGGTVRP